MLHRRALAALLLLVACDHEPAEAPWALTPVASGVPMPGFSWMVPGHIAGMPVPGAEHAPFLRGQGVDFVVSLTEEPPIWLVEGGLPGAHVPIVDMQPPTLGQQVAFVRLVEDELQGARSVAVHCTAGLGRTGTMLATWLVHQGLDPQVAIDHVREVRPGSIETEAQEWQVHTYAAYLTR